MTADELDGLLRRCPVLFHMAERGSWPSIQRYGLLSTSALLDQWQVTGDRRIAIEAAHRPQGVTLDHPKHGQAVVRDQKPMSDGALARCLTGGMGPTDWYRLLNGKVFFWLSEQRLLKLLGGKAYRELEHDVLELDAAALVGAYRDRIELSPINSGATFALGPASRGPGTFRPIAEYDYAGRKRPIPDRVVELTVAWAVPDAARFVRRVRRMRAASVVATVFERPG